MLKAQNNCLDFDGLDDFVTFGDVNDLGTSDFTIEAWVYLDGFDAIHKVLNKGITLVGTPSNAGYALQLSDNLFEDPIEFQIAHSDGSITTALFDGVTINTWFHLAGVREGTSIKLYIDGNVAATNDTGIVYDVDTNIPLSLGALYRPSLGPSRYFIEGQLDEVRIWNKARTQAEIQSTLFQELNGDEANLLAYYNFNQGIPGGDNPTETVLFDQTSNNNNGDLAYFSLNGNNSNWLGSLQLLPVELRSFTGRYENDQVLLSWQTSQEVANEGFSVERLSETEEWTALGFVAAQNSESTIKEYRFIDTNPGPGLNYYRLKQKDYDGSITVLEIIAVENQTASSKLRCYPNPASDQLFISGMGAGSYRIIDVTGATIKKGTISREGIPLSDISPGIYFIKVTIDGRSEVAEFYKK